MNTQSSDNFSDYSDDLEFGAAPEADEPEITWLNVPNQLAGARLDAALAQMLPDFSRSRLTEWIKDGRVFIDGKSVAPKHKLIGGETLEIHQPAPQNLLAFAPEPMPLDIVHEDEWILVLNKPAGLVVHPGAGNWTGTLLNGLIAHDSSLAQVPRAGIVHRLDKDTSGLMVVAKTLSAQKLLVEQMQARTVKRIYRAVADGVVPYDGKIETLIGRDPHQRTRMAVVKFGGKSAITHVKVLERYATHTYIECALETGRTHQIRVHLRQANHPLAGDPVYGRAQRPDSEALHAAIRALNRQALHAYRLSFRHPESGQTVSFEAPLPADFHYLLSVLRLENGLDSALAKTFRQPEDDWDDDDEHDVEIMYVRE